MSSRPAEEMRPGEIVAARERSGCAFVPVSPAFEWHSFHLPMGCDALIAESISRLTAEQVGGIWFRPLSFGLDEWRPERQLVPWGFDKADRIYGMNFPELPLASEYNEPPAMRAAVTNRLHAIKDSGFPRAFIVSSHGGTGQTPVLEALARECSESGFEVHFVGTNALSDVTDESLRVGGHAGLAETTWLLAFRPELVDLTCQEEGELSVRRAGILHSKPTIEPEHNPRHVSLAVACALRESVVSNFVKLVRETAGKQPSMDADERR